MKPLTLYQFRRHIFNLQSPDIEKALGQYVKRNHLKQSKIKEVEEILGIQRRGINPRYLIFRNANIVRDLETGDFYILLELHASYMEIIDGNDEQWDVDFVARKQTTIEKIQSKKEIVKSKYGCDARKKLCGSGG